MTGAPRSCLFSCCSAVPSAYAIKDSSFPLLTVAQAGCRYHSYIDCNSWRGWPGSGGHEKRSRLGSNDGLGYFIRVRQQGVVWAGDHDRLQSDACSELASWARKRNVILA